MNRAEMLADLEDKTVKWDMIVIGGGATGMGIAVDAASRGYKVLLLEQHDFAKGTSSRSTKLVHGGVRYLQQGNISLVLEALKERGILRRNAPHLVHNLPFIVPSYDWWQGPFYGIGLKLYDMLAGKEGFGHSKLLSKDKTIELLPTIESKGLIGGVIYYDGQFDDARLIINMAQTAVEQGAVPINYIRVTGLLKQHDIISGVVAVDQISGAEYQLKAKVVINATGVFADSILLLDCPEINNIIVPSQGIHLVLDTSFLPGESAIMVPHTDDGRILFAIPWHNRVLVGTTDTPVKTIDLEPKPFKEELSFLLEHAARYLTKDPGPQDVLSVFAGLRPLVNSGKEEATAAISRDHTVYISRCGLVTVAGGKWTTYRKMAEDTVDQAIIIGELEPQPCHTKELNIHGYHVHPEKFGDLALYGADAILLQELLEENQQYAENLHPGITMKAGEVIWAVRHEMAQSVEDVLARRTRWLLLDARVSVEMAPIVAKLMAGEMGKGAGWIKEQVAAYKKLAEGYVLK
jgi:glycerol-3-phosphate dehydrogenase